jgi:hypothetical protein
MILSLAVGQVDLLAAERPLLAAAQAEAARLQVQPKTEGPVVGPTAVRAVRPVAHPSAAQSQQAPANGSRKGLKIAFAIGAAVAFAASAYAIDREVENNTPSSLGQRLD